MPALYRKYRPLTLADVVGQDSVVQPLQGALKSKKINHAYLFVGPRGCGKTSVARIFAHEINNFPYSLEDSYVDIVEIDAASNRSIDDIRELREKVAIAPTQGKYKIYIIDEVHMLTREAFNALLKTLEEPPAHVVFIMATTNPEKLPVTITSRAQKFLFSLAPTDVMTAHLQKIADAENIKITPEALSIVVRRGGGSFRDSISLLDQVSSLKDGEISAADITSALGLPDDDIIKNLLAAYSAQDATKITEALRTTFSSGIKAEIVAAELIARIIESPTPILLPLLEKLPAVSAPFADAKLLLAFLNHPNISAIPSAPVVTPVAASAPTSAPTPKTTPVAAPAPATVPTPTPAPAPTPTPVPTEVSGAFDWDTFLNSLSPLLRKKLETTQHEIKDHAIYIYTTPAIKSILDSPNNRRKIDSLLGGYALIIDTDTAPTKPDASSSSSSSSSTLSNINDIMGGEVEVINGNNPF